VGGECPAVAFHARAEPSRHLVRQASDEGCGFAVEVQAWSRGRVERHRFGVDALGAHRLKDGPLGRSAQRDEYGLAGDPSSRERLKKRNQDARVAVLLGAAVARFEATGASAGTCAARGLTTGDGAYSGAG
jgi:hypothetical protein